MWNRIFALGMLAALMFIVSVGCRGEANKPDDDRDMGKKSEAVPGATKAEKKQKEVVLQEEITNSIGMKFRLIPPGSFMMGALPGDEEALDSEKPQHRVEITKPFYTSIYEVTQEQYESVMGTNPSDHKGSKRPVQLISWEDAMDFCKKLSEKEGVSYRLPTEAEWEYACRAGTATRYYWGDKTDGDSAWYEGNSGGETHEVGLKSPNAWGLYDMSGNVWEWCSDWHDKDYYNSSPGRDPLGSSLGDERIMRGGSFADGAWGIRSSSRMWFQPVSRGGLNVGFRVVRDVE
ncbi:MAG TPA: formylglycine-generating enzyme family protein [Acidobacteriota bacterium]|nr:formylglycine-generating enzyme family protein [Acidobacteriota bacterium]